MDTIRLKQGAVGEPGAQGPGDRIGRPAAPGGEEIHVERDHLSWAEAHGKDVRRHAAELAQITTHHDLDGNRDALGQQEAWARRRSQERHLRESALAQLRNQTPLRPSQHEIG